jgi:hypothetical protein
MLELIMYISELIMYIAELYCEQCGAFSMWDVHIERACEVRPMATSQNWIQHNGNSDSKIEPLCTEIRFWHSNFCSVTHRTCIADSADFRVGLGAQANPSLTRKVQHMIVTAPKCTTSCGISCRVLTYVESHTMGRKQGYHHLYYWAIQNCKWETRRRHCSFMPVAYILIIATTPTLTNTFQWWVNGNNRDSNGLVGWTL